MAKEIDSVIASDMQDSKEACQLLIIPFMQQHFSYFQKGLFVSLEGIRDQRLVEMDMNMGLDMMFVKKDDLGAEFISSRVQFMRDKNGKTMNDGKPYNTFSTKYANTLGSSLFEFQKRITAIKNNTPFPTWTLQAYISERGGQLLSLAIARTKALYLFIDKNPGLCRSLKMPDRREGGYEVFSYVYVVRWIELYIAKAAIEIWDGKQFMSI